MKDFILLLTCAVLLAGACEAFDGSKWNVSTGNLSVSFIQASPIGAHPRPGYMMEPPPSVESMAEMKKHGLVAYEDYVAWGAVEREPGKWDWTQHDRICEAVKKAGLHYVVYNWVHFPPAWLRNSGSATLMRCVEHRKNTNYLSIFDPRTIEYYDHFYKALSQHFGDKIDGVYACILGPYGEGNYPLYVPNFIDMGHCHEGYWCEDPYALSAFREAMRKKYGDISKLNDAWGLHLMSFSDVRPPGVIADGAVCKPETFKTAADRRTWLDFIAWYHQAIIDFAEKSIQVTLKYFPREKVRMKPGGNAGGVNPIAWGTYCPGYARMAAKYGIVLQPADCKGACFGDKWIGTAYHFYGVKLSTEPAGGLDRNAFVRRMFSDASCGASQLFTYEFTSHAPEIEKYVHLYTGRPGDTDVAVLCPTTLYRLGGDIGPTIRAADGLRDVTDFDVLDELLIQDGALEQGKYHTLIMFQGGFVEQSILDRIEDWVRRGGTLIAVEAKPIRSVEGQLWAPTTNDGSGRNLQTRKLGRGTVACLFPAKEDGGSFDAVRSAILPFINPHDSPDGVWTTRRGDQVIMLNTTDKPVKVKLTVRGKRQEVEVPPHEIWE